MHQRKPPQERGGQHTGHIPHHAAPQREHKRVPINRLFEGTIVELEQISKRLALLARRKGKNAHPGSGLAKQLAKRLSIKGFYAPVAEQEHLLPGNALCIEPVRKPQKSPGLDHNRVSPRGGMHPTGDHPADPSVTTRNSCTISSASWCGSREAS
jgi:hypothetical protein